LEARNRVPPLSILDQQQLSLRGTRHLNLLNRTSRVRTMLETSDHNDRARRRRMRLYPTLATAAAQHPDHPLLRRKLTEEDRKAERRRQEDTRRTAIVSLYGEDLSSEDEIQERPDRRKGDKAA
jgi:hypothetical protein